MSTIAKISSAYSLVSILLFKNERAVASKLIYQLVAPPHQTSQAARVVIFKELTTLGAFKVQAQPCRSLDDPE
jgi:hypothetical protein